jgi:hypothetical protein
LSNSACSFAAPLFVALLQKHLVDVEQVLAFLLQLLDLSAELGLSLGFLAQPLPLGSLRLLLLLLLLQIVSGQLQFLPPQSLVARRDADVQHPAQLADGLRRPVQSVLRGLHEPAFITRKQFSASALQARNITLHQSLTILRPSTADPLKVKPELASTARLSLISCFMAPEISWRRSL